MPKPAGNAVLVGLDCREIGEKDPSYPRRWVGLAGSSGSPEQASGGSSLYSTRGAPPTQSPDSEMQLEHRASSRFLRGHPELRVTRDSRAGGPRSCPPEGRTSR